MSKKRYIIPIFVPHLGCPHDCVFCNQRKITNHDQAVDKEEVIKTIEKQLSYFPDTDAVKEIAFFGGSFTAIPRNTMIEYLSIAKKYKDANLIQEIRLSTRPDCIDKEILDILKEFGVNIIELGVQSMDDHVLFVNARGHDSQSVRHASILIKEYGFTLGHQIMPGLYQDSYEKIMDTVRQSIDIGPDIVRVYPTLIVKNTVLETLYEEGLYEPLTLEEAVDICAEILPMYKAAGIPVIRVGLQVTENINLENDIVKGPFHSSLRQLVEQKLYLKAIKKTIKENQLDLEDKIQVYVNKSLTSYVVGQKAINKIKLIEEFNFKNIKFIPIEDNTIYIKCKEQIFKIGDI